METTPRPDASPGASSTDGPRLDNRRILVIDDNKTDKKFVGHILQVSRVSFGGFPLLQRLNFRFVPCEFLPFPDARCYCG